MGDTTWIKMLPGNVLKGNDAINKDISREDLRDYVFLTLLKS